MRRLSLAVLLGTCAAFTALGQEGPTISGFVNVSANVNFNDGVVSELRAYDGAADTFLLNTAHVAITGSPSDGVDYVIELDIGNDAVVTSGDDDFDVQEAYITYKLGDSGCSLKMGKFATYMGIEVIESPDNPVISRGFLYGLAESFTHTGIVLEHTFSDKLDVAVGVVNGWDVSVNDGMQTLVAKVGITPNENFGVSISLLSGADGNNGADLFSWDVTGSAQLGEKVSLNFQVNSGEDDDPTLGGKWSGFALEPVFTITDTFSLGARFEVFDDKDGVRAGGAGDKYTNFTVAPTFKLSESLTLRAEVRIDTADKGTPFEGGVEDSQTTLALELISTF